jgi:flagellar biosynthetic protein FliR
MVLLDVPAHYLPAWLLVSARIGAALTAMPLFGARHIPPLLRLGLGALAAAVMLPVSATLQVEPPDGLSYVLLLARELALGLLLGFLVNLATAAAQFAAGLLDVQVGFNFASTIDPMLGEQGALLERFYAALAVLVFLQTNAHHLFFQSVQRTFELMPVGAFVVDGLVAERVIAISAQVFSAAVGLAIPVLGPLLVTDLAMAVMARAMPQLNVLAVNPPVKMLVGMLALALAMGLVVSRLAAILRGAAPFAAWVVGG